MFFARSGFLFAVSLIAFAQTTAVQFAPPSYFQIAASPTRGGSGYAAIATGDVNGDGFQDIVIQLSQGNSITTLLGDGAGGFAGRVDTQIGAGFSTTPTLALADFNNDGRLDLVAYTGTGVQLLTGDG